MHYKTVTIPRDDVGKKLTMLMAISEKSKIPLNITGEQKMKVIIKKRIFQ